MLLNDLFLKPFKLGFAMVRQTANGRFRLIITRTFMKINENLRPPNSSFAEQNTALFQFRRILKEVAKCPSYETEKELLEHLELHRFMFVRAAVNPYDCNSCAHFAFNLKDNAFETCILSIIQTFTRLLESC